MKSVIAEGANVAKAVEEALKKAGMPQEFFIKILQESQSGFLGFGSKKAKIALFFKKEDKRHQQEMGLLSQDSYRDLFNNKSLQKQVEQQERAQQPVNPSPKPVTKPQQQQQQQQQPRKVSQIRPMSPKNNQRSGFANDVSQQSQEKQTTSDQQTQKRPFTPRRRWRRYNNNSMPKKNGSDGQ